MSLLVGGGVEDPNLEVLVRAAQTSGIGVVDLRTPREGSQGFSWDLDKETLTIRGEQVQVRGAFLRYDVFAAMQDPRVAVSARAGAWFQAAMGWLYAHPEIKIFNRDMTPAATNKPAVLIAARRASLKIPATLVSNEASLFEDTAGRIAKPVAGGDYCYPLEEAIAKSTLREGLLPAPALIQQRLRSPETRIYVVGGQSFAFDMKSDSLDYRVKQDVEISLLPEMPKEIGALRILMAEIKMDFGAADFKTDASGELVFLELNTSPMFAQFDRAAGGRLAGAIALELHA